MKIITQMLLYEDKTKNITTSLTLKFNFIVYAIGKYKYIDDLLFDEL